MRERGQVNWKGGHTHSRLSYIFSFSFSHIPVHWQKETHSLRGLQPRLQSLTAWGQFSGPSYTVPETENSRIAIIINPRTEIDQPLPTEDSTNPTKLESLG